MNLKRETEKMVSLHPAGIPMHVLRVCNPRVGIEIYHPDWNKDCVPHCLREGGGGTWATMFAPDLTE